VVLLAALPKRQRATVERLRTLPEIDHCLAVAGEFDLLVGIEASLNQDLDGVIDRIAAIDGVERCKALVVLSTRSDRREGTSRAA
jgi:DNA-binding Lrp family transcriptional regulator